MNSKENETSKKDRAEPAPGVLYLVGTPIGNLGDFSPRAKSLLLRVSLIACEDTRRSSLLLKNYGIKTALISFHKHNTKSRIPQIIQKLSQKQSVALITDAGLPAISDPGEELVSASIKANHEVICIPGPCAAITALAISGLPTNRFSFEGFLPIKGKERKKLLETISQEDKTTIIYESPHKLIKLLKELSDFCGEKRPIHISRELTKRFEEKIGTTIKSAIKHFEENKPQGEFTIVLGGKTSNNPNDIILETELIKKVKALIAKGESKSNAIRLVSEQTGVSRRSLYSKMHGGIHNE